MSMPRRDFIKLTAAQMVLLGLASNGLAQMKEPSAALSTLRKAPSILQGASDESSAQFSILYRRDVPLVIQVADEQGNKFSPQLTEYFFRDEHELQITRVAFTKLPAGQDLKLLLQDSVGAAIDERQFRTLSLDSASPISFALCSCMNDENHEPMIWRNLVDKNPDIILFTGDSVYADAGAGPGGADPVHLWQRFCEARMTLEIYFSPRLVPILATWDDHDFGLNDSNSRSYPYVAKSQINFLQFFAQSPAYCRYMQTGPGVSSAYTFGNQLFILMDDRSYRLERGSSDRYAHWGQAQEQWALDLIRAHQGPTWLVNGSQIFPAMPFKESLSNDHKNQFFGFLAELKNLNSKLIFISGDVHFSEISRIEAAAVGYPTYELTSSSMHSRNTPGTPRIIPNKRRTIATGVRNYLLVEATALDSGAKFQTTSFGIDGRAIFSEALEV